MKQIYFFLLSLSFFTTTSFAQSWHQVYQFNDALIQGFQASPTSDGGYIFVGASDYPTGAVRHYVHLLKTDSEGNKLWEKAFNMGGAFPNPPSTDEGRFIQETSDGNYLLAGYRQMESSQSAMFLAKLTDIGDTIWTRDIATMTDPCLGFSALIDANGDYVIAGKRHDLIAGTENVYFAKTDSDGNLLWTKQYFETSTQSSEILDIKSTNDQGYILVGSLGSEVLVIKTDQQGNSLWTKSFGFSNQDKAHAVAVNNDGTYIVGGSSVGFVGYAPFILKLSTAGEKIWEKSIPDLIQGGVADLIVDDAEDIVVTGSKFAFFSNYAPEGFLAKLDADGEQRWLNKFEDPNLQYHGHSVRQTSDGGYIIGGGSSTGMLLIKTNNNGVFDLSNSIANPPEILSLNVNPNPTSDWLTIHLPQGNKDLLQLNIFDYYGRLVRETTISSNANVATCFVADLPAGSYVVRIQRGMEILGIAKFIHSPKQE
ncbi:MAG: T9SS type A sorting domain-containing protein [Saprospiraceae bacterium]